MEQHDFYVEFYEELDKRLEHFFDFAESGRACVSLAGFPVKEALRTYLFYCLSIERTPYDRCRRQGMGVEDAMSRVDAFLDRLQDATPAVPEDTGEDVRVEVWEHPWKDALEACRGCLLVYVFNARQLQALVPLLERMERPVVLLSEYDIPDDVFDNIDNVYAVIYVTYDYDGTFQGSVPNALYSRSGHIVDNVVKIPLNGQTDFEYEN